VCMHPGIHPGEEKLDRYVDQDIHRGKYFTKLVDDVIEATDGLIRF